MRRLPSDRYASDRHQAVRSARHQVDFVIENIVHLRRIDRKGKLERAVKSFSVLLKAGEDLTPGQLSYLDSIYENTMKGAGLPAVGTHHDPGPRR